MLIDKGIFIIDYFNPTKIIHDLVPHQTIVQGGINFHIHKETIHDQILKHISFLADNQSFAFTEQVRTYTHTQLAAMLNAANFEVKNIFGSYNLEDFDPQSSPRQIIIAQAQ
jgi:Trk-type K+ transport system membrane component